MKVKQTVVTFGGLLVIAGGLIAPALPVSAAQQCGDAKTSIISCDTPNKKSDRVEDNAIWKLLIMVLNIMIAGVGILAVGGIVYGSVLYASAGDRPEQTKKAKEIILNVVIGLIAFGLMYSLLNFLIPGGIFN